MLFLWSVCEKQLSTKSSLIRHISHIHSAGPSKCYFSSFTCNSCQVCFSRKSNLQRHIFKVYSPNVHERHKIMCLYCISINVSRKFFSRKALREHSVEVHYLDFREKTLSFSSMSEFKIWQMNVQQSTLCHFISTRDIRQVRNDAKNYYLICHRDGYFT